MISSGASVPTAAHLEHLGRRRAVSVPVLSKTMASAFASRSRNCPPLTSTPSRAASVIAASALVGTAMRMPVPKSVMSTLVIRSICEARTPAAPATPKVGRTSRSAIRSASRCSVIGLAPAPFEDLDDLRGGRVAPDAVDLDDDLPFDHHGRREHAVADLALPGDRLAR